VGGIGFTEMLLLAVIALIVVGPRRLPRIARTAGKLTRQARHAWQNLQSELQSELDAEHNREVMRDQQPDASDPDSGAPQTTDPSGDGPRRSD